MGHLVGELKQKHSVLVITSHASGLRAPEEGVYRARWSGLIPFAVYALWRSAWVLRNRDIQVIFGGSVVVTPLVLILARLFGRKAVVQAHGLDLIYRSVPYQALCVRWIKWCDRLIANSSFTKSLAIHAGAEPERIAIIPPGVEPERYSFAENVETIAKELGLGGKKIILFVGRLARRKGVKEFIRNSLPEIIREVPNACFVVVGDNPSESLSSRDNMLGEIKKIILETGLQDRVRLVGALNDTDVIKLYQACDVVVLPVLPIADDVEGFGIVLLEAAAAGKPTVATRVGGIPDAVEDDKSGILVEPDDYHRLSQAVISLLKNRGKSLAMGEFGQRRVREQFAWSRVSALYEAAFDTPARS